MTYSRLHGPTVLETWDLDDGTKLIKYEALKHTLSSPQRRDFVFEGVLPAEYYNHKKYWRDTYSRRTSLPEREAENAHRTSFIQHPVFVAVSGDGELIGGLWTEGKTVEEKKPRTEPWPRYNRTALFHICLEPECQGTGLGTAMLQVYEDQMQNKYEALECGWDDSLFDRDGSRLKQYFTKRGYVVEGDDVSGVATKKL